MRHVRLKLCCTYNGVTRGLSKCLQSNMILTEEVDSVIIKSNGLEYERCPSIIQDACFRRKHPVPILGNTGADT